MFARIEAGLRDVLFTARPGVRRRHLRHRVHGDGDPQPPPGRDPLSRQRRILRALRRGRRVVRARRRSRDGRRWGETFDLNVVESALHRRAYAALTVAHSETSTGVLTDVRAVAELAHRHGAMAIVDSVSGAGGAELMVDAWELDFVLTGSRKALALPPASHSPSRRPTTSSAPLPCAIEASTSTCCSTRSSRTQTRRPAPRRRRCCTRSRRR